jgi:flagellar biosynthesis GTPase FlhF
LTPTVRCPKCSSNAHAFLARHPFIYNKSELQVACQFCGTRKYGEDATRLVAAAKEEAARKEAERKELAARKEAEHKEAERKEAERKEAEHKEAERKEAERKEAERKEAFPPQSAPAFERKTEGDDAAMLEEIKHVEAKAAARMIDARAKNDRAELARLRREQLVEVRAIALNYKGVEALCASPWCANPRPIDRRYCEKKCSDDVARERYLEKKNRVTAP